MFVQDQVKNYHEIIERNLLPGLLLISFISIHVTMQIKYFMSGSQTRPLSQKGILLWSGDIISVETFLCVGHRSTSHDWSPAFLQSAALQHCRRQDNVIWDQWLWRAAVHFLSGHRHQSAPDFSLRKILTREFDSVPRSPKALQNCNNVFFGKYWSAVFS